MNIKKGFHLRNVCGENIIVAEGEENIDFSNIISMNESSSALWKEAERQKEFSVESLTTYLCSLYDVEQSVAQQDVERLVSQWAVAGIIEGNGLPDISGVEVPLLKSEDDSSAAHRQAQPVTEKPKKKGFFARLFGK